MRDLEAIHKPQRHRSDPDHGTHHGRKVGKAAPGSDFWVRGPMV
jgi:hypothetical protein